MRTRAAVIAILMAVALVALAASLTAVETTSAPPPGKVRVTAFAKVSIFGSSGATTFTLGPNRAAAIIEALRALPSVPAPSCHENALIYELAVRNDGSRASSFVVNGWECESTVAKTERGQTTWLYDGKCALLRAVKAALPPHVAEGTRDAPCVRLRVTGASVRKGTVP